MVAWWARRFRTYILRLASGETFVASGNQFDPRKTEIDPNARNFVYICTSKGVYIIVSYIYIYIYIYVFSERLRYRIYIYLYICVRVCVCYWPRPKRVIIRIALLVGKTLTAHHDRRIIA